MYAPDASFLTISPQQRECLDQLLLPSVMIEIPWGLNWSKNEWLKICHIIYLREKKFAFIICFASLPTIVSPSA
jgi:hypothetical protein